MLITTLHLTDPYDRHDTDCFRSLILSLITHTDSFLARPLGRCYKLKESKSRLPVADDKLEAIFKRSRGKPKDHHVAEAVKATDKTERSVRKWFALRRQLNQPTTMDKFSETLWRLVFYTTATVYGFVTLWDKSWFADTKYCWVRLAFQIRSFYLCCLTVDFHFSLGCHFNNSQWKCACTTMFKLAGTCHCCTLCHQTQSARTSPRYSRLLVSQDLYDTLFCLGCDPPRRDDTADIFFLVVG